MKTTRNLFLGLIIVFAPFFVTNGHATTNNSSGHHITKATLIKKKKITDALWVMFTWHATETSTNYWRIDVTCNTYDVTTGTIASGSCPTTVNILMDSGPFEGDGFDFPSGTTTYTVATIFYPTDPNGADFNITTNPTSINGFPVDQHLIGGAIE